jgi:mannose-6-phosphate isomerase-like protein (cupin superfamily)
MAKAGDVFELNDGEKVLVRTASADSGGQLLEVEAEWVPKSHRPLPHFHPSQDEHFEILDGEVTVKLGKEQRVLRAGDSVDIPRGTVHTFANTGSTVARAKWQVRPAQRTEFMFETVHRLREAGHGASGGLDLVAGGLVAHEYKKELVPAIPGAARTILFPVLAGWARMRGYPKPS